MNYSIVIFPQKHIQDFINSYRKRYDPQYNLIPPHIKLKGKFVYKEEKLEDIVKGLEEIATKTKPFTINFTKIKSFYPIINRLFFIVENEQPIIDLHNKINKLFSKTTKYKYIPHLTIGQKMSEEELHDIYGSLRMKKFDLQTKIDRFHLMYELKNMSWNIYQSFVFKNF